MQQASLHEQQSYFRMVVDAHLLDKIDTQIQEDTPIIGTDNEVTCMKLLEEEFLLRYPLLSRRADFFGTKQTKGQLFSDWAVKLKSRGEETDLYQLTTEDLHNMRYLTGVVDKKLRTEFLKEVKPTLKLLNKIVHQYEIATFSEGHDIPGFEGAAGISGHETTNKNTFKQGTHGPRKMRPLRDSRSFGTRLLSQDFAVS